MEGKRAKIKNLTNIIFSGPNLVLYKYKSSLDQGATPTYPVGRVTDSVPNLGKTVDDILASMDIEIDQEESFSSDSSETSSEKNTDIIGEEKNEKILDGNLSVCIRLID